MRGRSCNGRSCCVDFLRLEMQGNIGTFDAMYETLHVDPALEYRELSHWEYRAGRFLKRLIPCLAFGGPPPTRRSVIKQLSNRLLFPSTDWEKHHSASDAQKVLATLARELNLPNGHFVPDDLLEVVLVRCQYWLTGLFERSQAAGVAPAVDRGECLGDLLQESYDLAGGRVPQLGRFRDPTAGGRQVIQQ